MAAKWVVREVALKEADAMLTQADADGLTMDAIAVYISADGTTMLVCVFSITAPVP